MRTDASISSLACARDRAERLHLAFVAQVAVVDSEAARLLARGVDPISFADSVRGQLVASALGLAARGGRIDLVDIVGDAALQVERPDELVVELAAAVETFDAILGEAASGEPKQAAVGDDRP